MLLFFVYALELHETFFFSYLYFSHGLTKNLSFQFHLLGSHRSIVHFLFLISVPNSCTHQNPLSFPCHNLRSHHLLFSPLLLPPSRSPLIPFPFTQRNLLSVPLLRFSLPISSPFSFSPFPRTRLFGGNLVWMISLCCVSKAVRAVRLSGGADGGVLCGGRG